MELVHHSQIKQDHSCPIQDLLDFLNSKNLSESNTNHLRTSGAFSDVSTNRLILQFVGFVAPEKVGYNKLKISEACVQLFEGCEGRKVNQRDFRKKEESSEVSPVDCNGNPV